MKLNNILAACLATALLYQSAAYAGEGPGDDRPGELRKASKASDSRNNGSVKIYPDILKRVMHVVARDGDENQNIDFFVFSTDGTMVHHYKMKSGDHQRMVRLERGRYIFRVFAGDEETASGNFEVR